MTIKLIPLTQGKFAIVDADDFEWLSQWKWYCNNGYAVKKTLYSECPQRQMVMMHRIINSTPSDLYTDHINGNKLDNRRSNLRTCTNAQNQHNQKKRRGRSTYKGVTYCERNKYKKWKAAIRLNGKCVFIGSARSEIEAAKLYNKAAIKYYGEFADLNKFGDSNE